MNLLQICFIFSGTVIGLFSTKYDNLPVHEQAEASRKPDFDIMTNYVQIPEKETLQKGDFLRSLSVTPSPTIAAPVPYYTTSTHRCVYMSFRLVMKNNILTENHILLNKLK